MIRGHDGGLFQLTDWIITVRLGCLVIVLNSSLWTNWCHLNQQLAKITPFSPNCLRLTDYYTHTRLTALYPGLLGLAGTRKVKPIWISLKQEIVSGSGIKWTICKSAPRSRQITTPAPHHSASKQQTKISNHYFTRRFDLHEADHSIQLEYREKKINI